MKIMFDDLTDKAQARLLRMAGVSSPEELNWDTLPVAEVELFEDIEADDDEIEDGLRHDMGDDYCDGDGY